MLCISDNCITTSDSNSLPVSHISISYSVKDEKLYNVLGHFQSDFEGEVSAENLGM